MPQAGGQQLPAPPAATASQPPAHMQKPEYQSKKASPNTTPKKKASERQTAKPYLDNRLVPLSAELLSAQAEVYVTDSHALVAEAASEPLTHVHVRAVTGRAQLERCAEEDGDQGYVDWLADSARGTPLVAEFDSGAALPFTLHVHMCTIARVLMVCVAMAHRQPRPRLTCPGKD